MDIILECEREFHEPEQVFHCSSRGGLKREGVVYHM